MITIGGRWNRWRVSDDAARSHWLQRFLSAADKTGILTACGRRQTILFFRHTTIMDTELSDVRMPGTSIRPRFSPIPY